MRIGAVSQLLLFFFVLVGLAHSPFRLTMAADHIDLSEQFVADLVGGAFEKLSSDLSEPIREEEREFRWPLGRRPDDHPGLSDLGL